MADKLLLISKFNGGIASGSKAGVEGAFRWGQGLEIHYDPDVLMANLALIKDSGATVVDLPLFGVNNTVNSNKYFLGDAGKVYKRTIAGAWSVVTTKTNAQGIAWFAGTSRIHFVSGNIEYRLNPADDSVTQNRALNSSTWHPVESFLDKVFIGNGREIISTDGSGIDENSTTVGGGITLDYNYSAKCFKNLGDWLFIGATSDNSSDARFYIWDGVSEKYNYARTLKGEDGINAVEVSDDGTVLVFAGKKGNIYQLTGIESPLTKKKVLPRIEKNKTIEVYPGSTANYQGKLIFGLSSGTSVTAERGVYSWTSTDINYPKVLNMDYPISTGTTTGTTLQIGCLLAADSTNLFVGWRDGTSYGVDLIDGSSYQTTAIWESLIHDNGAPFRRKHYKTFKIELAKALEEGETVDLKYKKDRGSWTDIDSISFTDDGAIKEKRMPFEIKANELELKLTLTGDGSSMPEVDSLSATFEDEPLI